MRRDKAGSCSSHLSLSVFLQDSSLFPSFKILTWNRDLSVQLGSEQGLQSENNVSEEFSHGACGSGRSTPRSDPGALVHTARPWRAPHLHRAVGGGQFKVFPHPAGQAPAVSTKATRGQEEGLGCAAARPLGWWAGGRGEEGSSEISGLQLFTGRATQVFITSPLPRDCLNGCPWLAGGAGAVRGSA